jgi:hypothetical protein
MVSVRFLGMASSTLLLVGALLVGEALHVTFVQGSVSITSGAFLGPLVLGSILLALGYRARAPVAEAYDLTSDSEESGGPKTDAPRADDTEEEYDPELSPLGDAEPGEAREDRDTH